MSRAIENRHKSSAVFGPFSVCTKSLIPSIIPEGTTKVQQGKMIVTIIAL